MIADNVKFFYNCSLLIILLIIERVTVKSPTVICGFVEFSLSSVFALQYIATLSLGALTLRIALFSWRQTSLPLGNVLLCIW